MSHFNTSDRYAQAHGAIGNDMPLVFLAAKWDKELLALSTSPHARRNCSLGPKKRDLLQTLSLRPLFQWVRLQNETRFGQGSDRQLVSLNLSQLLSSGQGAV